MPSSSADLIVWFIEIMVKMLRKKQRKENSETIILTKEVTRKEYFEISVFKGPINRLRTRKYNCVQKYKKLSLRITS